MTTNTQTTADNQPQLQKLAGLAFIAMALCYISLFIIYGAILSKPTDGGTTEKIAYLVEHKALYNFTYVLGYMFFACLLCFCVYVISTLDTQASKATKAMTSLFGYFWVLVLLCTGMIGLTANELITGYQTSNPAAAEVIYFAKIMMTESLGGGIEFIGGVWLVLLAVMIWRHSLASKPLAVFTLIKGAVGIATLCSAETILREIFGVTGIVWFIWMGIALIKSR